MKFTKKMRGYDPKEVDKYVAETEQNNNRILSAQRQRIDELSDENASLRMQIARYISDEQAISKSLVDSQKLALQLKGNAEQFAELTISRAKIFYATWQAYSQTLISTLTDEEVRQFNEIKQKLENIINAFDGKDVESFARAAVSEMQRQESAQAAATFGSSAQTLGTAQTAAPATPQAKNVAYANPLDKVKAAEQKIDLRELVKPTESLADLCKELGLNVDD